MEASKKKDENSLPHLAFSLLFFLLLLALLGLFPQVLLKTFLRHHRKSFYCQNSRNSRSKLSSNRTNPLINSISKFNFLISTNGIIKKPIAIPNTYQRIEQHEKGITDMIHAMVDGTIEVADIMIFIFILGGMIGVINKTGALMQA